MEHRFRDGWPGIVGLAVLAAGIAFLHGEPHVTEVGGFLRSEFEYTTAVVPDLPIDTEDAGTVQPAVEGALGTMKGVATVAGIVTVVGIFEDETQATAALEGLDLGVDEVRLAWGRLAIIMSPHVEAGRTHSLVSAMGALTDHVVAEGDWFSEDAIFVDLRCEASDRRTAGTNGALAPRSEACRPRPPPADRLADVRSLRRGAARLRRASPGRRMQRRPHWPPPLQRRSRRLTEAARRGLRVRVGMGRR
jgi:hypothetical protein